MLGCPPTSKFPHAARWYRHIASHSATERSSWPGQKAVEAPKKTEDDDFDLFGEETAEEVATKKAMNTLPKKTEKKKKEVSSMRLALEMAGPSTFHRLGLRYMLRWILSNYDSFGCGDGIAGLKRKNLSPFFWALVSFRRLLINRHLLLISSHKILISIWIM